MVVSDRDGTRRGARGVAVVVARCPWRRCSGRGYGAVWRAVVVANAWWARTMDLALCESVDGGVVI